MLSDTAFHPTSLVDAIQQASDATSMYAAWDRYNTVLGLSPTVNEASVVTDFGCGPGLLSKQISRRFNGTLQCFDPSEEMLSHCQEWLERTPPTVADPTRLRFVNDPAELLPADVCFCTWILQHANANLPETVGIISEHVAPGGILVTVDYEGFDISPIAREAGLTPVLTRLILHGKCPADRSTLSLFVKD